MSETAIWLVVVLAAGILFEVVKLRRALEECLKVLKRKQN
jgi:hypothetical protein